MAGRGVGGGAQQALADLNTAYRNFFTSVAGKRQGRRMAPPRFRSRKDNRQTIRFTRNARFTVRDNGRLRLPKIGDLHVRWSRPLPAEPSSVTVLKDAAGRYFASFVVTTTDEPLSPVESEVGIDLGLTHFAVLSDGTKVTAPRFLRRAARKLRRLQQDLLDGPKPLAVRSWVCPCGAAHDRDVNAAINVLAQGRRDNSNACGARVGPAPVPAPRREAGIRPDAACSPRSVAGISIP